MHINQAKELTKKKVFSCNEHAKKTFSKPCEIFTYTTLKKSLKVHLKSEAEIFKYSWLNKKEWMIGVQ